MRLVIKPAKRRFGLPPRKQWRYTFIAGNGERIDPRDTYANPGDIIEAVRAIRSQDITVQVEFAHGMREFPL